MENKIVNYLEKLVCIKECLMDYSTPIYVVGDIELLKSLVNVLLPATISKKELVIINDKYPEWMVEVLKNASKENNVLMITDFDKISIEEQKLFVDIICNNQVSSEKLPDNLKIIITSNCECQILDDINEVIQFFEL